MTSISPDKNTDTACLVSPGEHHTCTHPSFIDYRRAVSVHVERLETFLQRAEATPKPPPADSPFLQRLRDGAEESEFLIGDLSDILYRQGLIRPF